MYRIPAQLQPPPPPPGGQPAEHPIRCPATLNASFGAANHDKHECIRRAHQPDGTEGILEHRCHCGATWEMLTRVELRQRRDTIADLAIAYVNADPDHADDVPQAWDELHNAVRHLEAVERAATAKREAGTT